jgi:hypothetical protein
MYKFLEYIKNNFNYSKDNKLNIGLVKLQIIILF